MADKFTQEKRSQIMKSIRSVNTVPEIKVRKKLHSLGFRFKLYGYDLPGKPDIVLPKYKVAILVNGCFWHGHSCKIGSGKRKPQSNQEYWISKIARNVRRDKENKKKLLEKGWSVITIWECETKIESKLIKKIKPLIRMKEDSLG